MMYGVLPSSFIVWMKRVSMLMLSGNAYLRSLLVWGGLLKKPVPAPLSVFELLPDCVIAKIASKTRWLLVPLLRFACVSL
jgi:hypothetical protein